MKYFLSIFILILSLTAEAQNMRGGVKGGINFSNLYVDDASDENLRLGLNIGIYTQLGQGFFVIQPELGYTTKGATFQHPIAGETSFKLNYIDFPILGTFKIGNDFDFHIGPYFGYLIVSKVDVENETFFLTSDVNDDQFNAIDIGGAFGMSINFEYVGVGVRYNLGFRDIAKSDAARLLIGEATNSTAQVFVALNL